MSKKRIDNTYNMIQMYNTCIKTVDGLLIQTPDIYAVYHNSRRLMGAKLIRVPLFCVSLHNWIIDDAQK